MAFRGFLPAGVLFAAVLLGSAALSQVSGAVEQIPGVTAPTWHLGDTWIYNVSANVTVRDAQVAGHGEMNRTVIARDEANGTWTVLNTSMVRGSGSYRGVPVAGILYDNTTVVARESDLGWLSRVSNRTATYVVFGAGVKDEGQITISWAPPAGGYAFPFRPGASWNGTAREDYLFTRPGEETPYVWQGTVQWFAEARGEEVLEVEGQSYKAFRVWFDDEPTDTDGAYWLRWWSPAVGNVVQEERFVGGERQLLATLTKYRYGDVTAGFPAVDGADVTRREPEPSRWGLPGPGLAAVVFAAAGAALLWGRWARPRR